MMIEKKYALLETWENVYHDLKKKKHSLNDINEFIGSEFRNQVYRGYGLNKHSFKMLEKLVGYKISTIIPPEKKGTRKYSVILKKNDKMAEMIGILLGDGSLAKRTVRITLNSDQIEYTKYVMDLCKSVFGLIPKKYEAKKFKAVTLVIFSVVLVEELVKLGLKTGNKVKNQVDVPDWIKENDQYSIACIRGLIDTDGYVGRYKRKDCNGFIYQIGFKNRSIPLLVFFESFFIEHGIHVCRGKDYGLIQGKKNFVKVQESIKFKRCIMAVL